LLCDSLVVNASLTYNPGLAIRIDSVCKELTDWKSSASLAAIRIGYTRPPRPHQNSEIRSREKPASFSFP
jgi:hypothetical protein